MTNNDQFLRNIGVALVAPGGYPADDAALARGIALLEQQGCVVHNYYDPAARHQRFGGTDASRVAQLHAAADNPDVQIVMAVRGGYGVTRILPALDFGMLAASGKLFVGHSDFTAFHLALLAQTDAISFAGPMICDDFAREDPSDFTLRHFWQCVRSPAQTIDVQTGDTDANPSVDLTGTLWGGNLAMLTHLVGTRYLPQVDAGILFVEDIHEHPYRIERMLFQLLHAGILEKQSAIVLGDFSNYRLTEYDNGYDFDAMLACLRAHLKIPVITGLPFGHTREKLTLPIGCNATLRTEKNRMQLSLTSYPTLIR